MNENFKKYWYLIVIVILMCIILYIVFYREEDVVREDIVDNTNYDNVCINEIVSEDVYVDIKGEVIKPGVYKISNGSRIIDVVNIAGGFTKNADSSLLNLSKKVIDEMNIKIYSKKEVENAKKSLNEPTIIEIIKEVEKECICPTINDVCNNNDNKNDALIDIDKNNDISEDNNVAGEETLININTASLEELMTISGIGEQKAKDIIEYREGNKFNKIEDIKNVSGIGDTLFEKIKNYITI